MTGAPLPNRRWPPQSWQSCHLHTLVVHTRGCPPQDTRILLTEKQGQFGLKVGPRTVIGDAGFLHGEVQAAYWSTGRTCRRSRCRCPETRQAATGPRAPSSLGKPKPKGFGGLFVFFFKTPSSLTAPSVRTPGREPHGPVDRVLWCLRGCGLFDATTQTDASGYMHRLLGHEVIGLALACDRHFPA